MLRRLRRIVKRLLPKTGFMVLTQEKWNQILKQKCLFLKELKETVNNNYTEKLLMAEGIVFSKDRPIQLHAALASYFEKVKPAVPLNVLFKGSSSRYEAAYIEVTKCFANRPVNFVNETFFRQDLISILEKIKSHKIFFLVDDIVFLEDVNMTDFIKVDTEKFIPSLRLGRNLKRCYTEGILQPLPHFLNGIITDAEKLCWLWRDGELDWGYPLSVDGHLFSTAEILAIAKVSQFKSPNSFESAMEGFAECFLDRYGVCYDKSKIVNIPCNKVQTENKNVFGSIDQLDLLNKWEKGIYIDYRKLYGFVNESAHQEIPLVFTKSTY